MHLMGDFNGWDREAHPCTKGDFGVWSLRLPNKDGQPAIADGSRVKVCVCVCVCGDEKGE